MFRSLLRNKQLISFLSGQSGTFGALSAQSRTFGSLIKSTQSGTFGALSKRFQSSKPFNQCANTCKCPNSENINEIKSMVLPTYFLTCGIGGYVIGDMIFTAIRLLK